MANVKVKFRPSKVEGKEGNVYYQVIHNRTVRHITTGYRLYPNEWHEALSDSGPGDGCRATHLLAVRGQIAHDMRRFREVIWQLEESRRVFDVDMILRDYRQKQSAVTFFSYMQTVIRQLREMGRERTTETYHAAYNSLCRFCGHEQLPFEALTQELMLRYEAFLKQRGVSKNTISFYMRILRAVYNRAVEEGLVQQSHPFRRVYTGIGKTVKRALPLDDIRRLKRLDLSGSPHLDIARDFFLFSFYTRGMSFIDMAYLQESNLKGKVLVYSRRKTGQQLFIHWEPCMQAIVDKYAGATPGNYLLPILWGNHDHIRRCYINALCRVNRNLRILGQSLQLSIPLTMYVARHSWASAARNKNIPLSVISEGMGHDSEKTTQIYLASLDSNVVDQANCQILSCI